MVFWGFFKRRGEGFDIWFEIKGVMILKVVGKAVGVRREHLL